MWWIDEEGEDRLERFRWAAWLLLLAIAVAVGCGSPGSGKVTVSGKTVFRAMGIEEVGIRVYRVGQEEVGPVAKARSGYHGSFAVRLPPGRYRLEAIGTVPAGDGRRELRGEVEVKVGDRRVDRVVIPLRDAGLGSRR
ncbi:MAG: hypothetical protein GXP50_08640 [Deltaproteobacteria bacterium]|nr:hypothetical protein [Deltaproteobacteria bacterium]